jgi:hypothetical protein
MSLPPDPARVADTIRQYELVSNAIRTYYASSDGMETEVFFGMTRDEREAKLGDILDQNEYAYCLVLLTALEGTLRLDKAARARDDDEMSRELRRRKNVNDLVKVHARHHALADEVLAECIALLTYRDWLAHGRHAPLPRVKKAYGFAEARRIVETVLVAFSLRA